MKTLSPLFFLLVMSIGILAQTVKNPDVQMIYWNPDKQKCSFCDSVTTDGSKFRIFDTPEFQLAYNTSYNDKLTYITVYLLNKSQNRIDFDPNQAILAVYKDRTVKLPLEVHPMSSEQAAKKMKGNQVLKNFFTGLAAGMAQRPITTSTTGTFTDINGNIITYEGSSQTSIPNLEAQRRAREIIEARNRRAVDRAEATRASAVKANTIFPGDDIFGNIFFPKVSGEVMWAGIRIGNKLYLMLVTL